ncbi:hypothetical protein BY996DRAFT_6588978 [Phakopsora pachyrhizi]|nr:hypothetical protein BY996DRAFT_6588978 [Phakopsora pachyrhizi]
MKQNHSYAVDSSLSRLKDLINPQDHQSREQAGALDQLNRVIKGLRNELDLMDQSSTLLSSQLEDLRTLCINTQMSFSPLSPNFMNPNQNFLSFDQRLILPDPAEKPGLHLPESLYPSETNGQITFGNHSLDLSQLQPVPESERLFTL